MIYKAVHQRGTQQRRFKRNNLQNVEKEISKLDEKIKEIEALMIDPQFFNSNEGKTKLKDYEQIKSNHALKSNEWENLFLQLEEL